MLCNAAFRLVHLLLLNFFSCVDVDGKLRSGCDACSVREELTMPGNGGCAKFTLCSVDSGK